MYDTVLLIYNSFILISVSLPASANVETTSGVTQIKMHHSLIVQ